MSDWVCRECAEKEPEVYEDATLLQINGVCEKCSAPCPDGVLVPKGADDFDENGGDQLPTESELAAWPNCETADCENKQCTWAGLPLCFPCCVRVLGRPELLRRFDATHDIRWGQTVPKGEPDEQDG